jgi:hypothetical protein
VIAAFTSSSPVASVALFDASGQLLFAASESAGYRAGEVLLNLLTRGFDSSGIRLGDLTGFAADLGPGSFTGSRVAIVLAKTLAYARGVDAAGATAFDIISPTQTVVFPSKRGEFFVREPGQVPFRTVELPGGSFTGFGFGGDDHFPTAAGFGALIASLEWQAPEQLIPNYLIEPSISVSKRRLPA